MRDHFAGVDIPVVDVPAAKEAPKVVEKVAPTPEVKEVTPPAPEVKATPTAPEVNPVEEFRKNISPKSQNRFKEMVDEGVRIGVEEFKKNAKLVTPEFEEKLTAAEQRAMAHEAELKQVAIERSPEFKTQFVERPKALEQQLRKLAQVHEIGEEDLMSAIRGGEKTERELDTILSSMGIIGSQKVAKLALEYQDIDAKKALVLADS